MTLILAHRGDTQNHSPNTREGVVSALEKCDGVELDLNLSSDGVFYFCHEGDWTDQILARRYEREAISLIAPRGESVLDLEEALQVVKQANKHLLIHAEIGGGGARWARDFRRKELQALLKIIGQSGIDRNQILFHTLDSTKAIELCAHMVFLRQPSSRRKRYGMYRFRQLMRVLPRIDANTTMAYVINDETEFQSLINAGIGYILTDKVSLCG